MKYDELSIQKRNKTRNTRKRIIGVFLIILLYNLILVIITNLSNYKITQIFGYKSYQISTNSMSPSINIGDVIVVKNVEVEQINIGDIITFQKNGEKITHRVSDIQKTEEGISYITKGDNNNLEDSEKITYDNIDGKYVLKIPFLGHIITFFQNQIIVLISLLVLLILCLVKMQFDEKKQIRREKKINEDEKNNHIV